MFASQGKITKHLTLGMTNIYCFDTASLRKHYKRVFVNSLGYEMVRALSLQMQ